MTAIELASPVDVSFAIAKNRKVRYWLVYGFALNDYAAGMIDPQLPSTSPATPLLGFGQCRSKTIVQVLSSNAMIVATVFELPGYEQWVGKPRAYSRTFALPPEKTQVPRWVKNANNNQYHYAPMFIQRGSHKLVYTTWSQADPVAVQNNLDGYVGRLVSGLGSGLHIFLGGSCQSDGVYTKVELEFYKNAAVQAVAAGSSSTTGWTRFATAIPALDALEDYAVDSSTEPPTVYKVPVTDILGTPVSYSLLVPS